MMYLCTCTWAALDSRPIPLSSVFLFALSFHSPYIIIAQLKVYMYSSFAAPTAGNVLSTTLPHRRAFHVPITEKHRKLYMLSLLTYWHTHFLCFPIFIYYYFSLCANSYTKWTRRRETMNRVWTTLNARASSSIAFRIHSNDDSFFCAISVLLCSIRSPHAGQGRAT